jgi:uncharacterized protein
VELSLLLVAGALVALAGIAVLSGFIGIGGGVLIIPLLTYVGIEAGLGDVAALTQAKATSLLISGLTALSGFLVHRRSAEPGDSRIPLAIAVSIGGFAGARVGVTLGEEAFPLFGGAIVIAAIGMLLRRERGTEAPLPSGAYAVALGLPIGFAATIMGLGGALFTGFVLSGILGFPVKRVAAATSLANFCGGMVGWIVYAMGSDSMPEVAPLSVGYVHLPTAAIALLVTLPLVRIGARWTHRMRALWPRLVFAAILLALAVKFFLR